MTEFSSIGKWLVAAGLLIAGIGCLITFAGKVPFLGKLPGDILIKKENFTFYFPLTTSIIASVVLSVIVYFINKK